MAAKTFYLVFFLVFCTKVESASLIERSYEYVMSLGKNIAPSFMSIMDCLGEDDIWKCTKEKAGKILENWDDKVDKQRRSWQEQADAEIMSSGRSLEEMPSKIGKEVEDSLFSISNLVQEGMARAFARKHGGGVDSVTVTTSHQKKKKQKQKPAKIHVAAPSPGKVQTWVIGDEVDSGRNLVSDLWSMGEKALDAVADHAIESDNTENGVEDKSSVEEQRGKKKKKKKAILKLLILGAVLKAKIGTLLQILSFKLQVKFFIIALIGLGINLARFWLDVKKQHQSSPQKVIYYEHAQHQHHYDHEDEPGWGGPWSRSMEPEDEIEMDADINNLPYRGQNPNVQIRPTRA